MIRLSIELKPIVESLKIISKHFKIEYRNDRKFHFMGQKDLEATNLYSQILPSLSSNN